MDAGGLLMFFAVVAVIIFLILLIIAPIKLYKIADEVVKIRKLLESK